MGGGCCGSSSRCADALCVVCQRSVNNANERKKSARKIYEYYLCHTRAGFMFCLNNRWQCGMSCSLQVYPGARYEIHGEEERVPHSEINGTFGEVGILLAISGRSPLGHRKIARPRVTGCWMQVQNADISIFCKFVGFSATTS